jgi:hypothetical protein
MASIFSKKANAKKAPPIKGKGTQKTVFGLLCVLVAIYAIVMVAIIGVNVIASGVLLFIIFGLLGGRILLGTNLFKWEFGLIMAFSVYSIIGNSVWTIPSYLDLIWDYGWQETILLEPIIANFVFLAIIILGYSLAFRNSPFKSWTS